MAFLMEFKLFRTMLSHLSKAEKVRDVERAPVCQKLERTSVEETPSEELDLISQLDQIIEQAEAEADAEEKEIGAPVTEEVGTSSIDEPVIPGAPEEDAVSSPSKALPPEIHEFFSNLAIQTKVA